MLILPIHRKPTRENLPVITVLLVLANALVFALFQSNDDVVEERAAERYLESGVLEFEWTWFREWAETTSSNDVEPEEIDELLPEVGEHERADFIRLMSIEREPAFLRAVEDEWFAPADSAAYRQWTAARERLEEDRQASFTRSYWLGYEDVRPATFLTHMFMHGGLMHLIGNMVFLVLLGILLEPALGGLRLLLAYLVGGLGAAGVSLAVHWGEGTGMVGASGAIAGMMGLLAIVYGVRRIRFFYWAFVYFDYVRAPALVLLPMWLGWEVFSFFISEGSNVAYDAHIGGLVSGALIGLVLVRTGQVREEWLDDIESDARLESDRESALAARSALDELDAAGAKRQLRPLLARHGRDPELLALYLAACQLRRDDPDLHEAVRRIFELPGNTGGERELVVNAFNRYLASTGGRLKIKASLALRLAGRFLDWRRVEEARALVDRLVGTGQPLPGLAELCRRLANGLGPDDAGLADRYRKAAERLSEQAGRTA
jgi:membrane associated rhomboid family serine protease